MFNRLLYFLALEFKVDLYSPVYSKVIAFNTKSSPGYNTLLTAQFTLPFSSLNTVAISTLIFIFRTEVNGHLPCVSIARNLLSIGTWSLFQFTMDEIFCLFIGFRGYSFSNCSAITVLKAASSCLKSLS